MQFKKEFLTPLPSIQKFFLACPPNEQFMSCGTACERTCDRPNPTICTLQCILNVCQCKEGYVRNKNNTCVLPQECPPRNCSRNEEWRNCSTCDGTCWNPNTICTQQCRPPRCQCQQGFVRNWFGQCVRPNSRQCWPWGRRNRKISSTIQETVPFPIPQYQNPCATVRCASNTTCFSVCPYNCPQDTSCSPRAACLPNNITTCASATCNKNESCIMQEVICVRAPCYPVPTCVPKNHHCALKNCPFNQVPNEEQEDV